MKKVMTILISFAIMLSIAIPTYAIDTNPSELNYLEISSRRIAGKLEGKSEIEVTEEILVELGMSKSNISKLSMQTKMDIYSASEIRFEDHYYKLDENGKETELSKKVCVEEVERINKAESMQKSTTPEIYENEKGDSYYNMQLVVTKTANAPQGTYGLILGYEWLKMPLFRSADVIGLSSDALVLNPSSISIYVTYMQTTTNNGTVKSERIEKDYNYSKLKNSDDFAVDQKTVLFRDNLPNTVPGTSYSVVCDKYAVMMVISSVINFPSLKQNFNVYGKYFHKTIMLSTSLAISGSGASFSISNSSRYETPKTISLSSPITYVP